MAVYQSNAFAIIVVAFRAAAPLHDRLYWLQPTIPHLTRVKPAFGRSDFGVSIGGRPIGSKSLMPSYRGRLTCKSLRRLPLLALIVVR